MNDEIQPQEPLGLKNFDGDFKLELSAIIAELCFIFLPFVVIIIVDFTKGDSARLIQTSDWSLASTLLFGQTIVKLIMGVAAQKRSFKYQHFGLITALIIVVGLVPSIATIIMFHFFSRLTDLGIVIQFILLGLSIFVFLVFGTIGQTLFLMARSKRPPKQNNNK